METIKLYLENMFMNLPQSEKVIKAKRELLSMMEDKYNELKSQGKTENEAVGIVISEFGNLDEIAEELGIKDAVDNAAEGITGKVISMEQVKEYLMITANSARKIAAGVFLCICAPIFIVILEGMTEVDMGIPKNIAEAIGVIVLLLLVATAVGIFIYSGLNISKYEYLKKEAFQLEYSVKQYVVQLQDSSKSSFALHITMGVVLCIISVIPVIITGSIDAANEFVQSLSVGLLLFLVAIAVVFFITAGMESEAYKVLLQQNEYETKAKKDKVMESISSAYWLMVTAGYLLWSFITNDWHFTWIVWPVAGIFFGVIASIVSLVRKDKG